MYLAAGRPGRPRGRAIGRARLLLKRRCVVRALVGETVIVVDDAVDVVVVERARIQIAEQQK